MPSEAVDTVRAWYRAINDEGAVPLGLCDEEIVIENVEEAPITGPYRGPAGARRWLEDIYDVVEDGRFALEEVLDLGDGETVLTAQRLLGRARHTGIDVDFYYAALWKIRDGKVLSAHGYATRERALAVAGGA